MSALAVELWSDLACNSGTATGALTVLSGTYADHLDNTDGITLSVQYDARVVVALRNVLRVTDEAGTVREYRVQAIGRTLANGTRTIKGVSILLDLATSGLVRTITGGVPSYAVGGTYTPTQFLDTYVLANLAADGVSWLARGTVDVTAAVALTAPATGWTRLEWVRQLADLSGAELRLRRNGSTSYYIDLVTRVGSSAGTVNIALGKNLLTLQEDTDDGELATAITTLGATVDGVPSSLAENAWTVGTVGGAGSWLALTDPEGGAAPIAIDDQVNGYSLLLKDATTLAISDSRASDSSVYLAAVTGLVAGDLVQIVTDSSATRIIELTSPAEKRLHRTETVSTLTGARNTVKNGGFAAWTSDTVCPSWTLNGSMAIGRYPRATRVDPGAVMLINGNQIAGVSTLNLKGGASGDRFYYGEAFRVNAGAQSYAVLDNVAVCDGSGNVTITLGSLATIGVATTLSANVTDGGATSGWFYVAPARPSALTSDGSNDCFRFLRSDVSRSEYAKSDIFKVKYVAGLPYINAAVGWTVVPGSIACTIAGYLPQIDLRNTTGGTSLASADFTSLLPLTSGATYNTTLSCSALLSADTNTQLRLLPGSQSTTDNAYRSFLAARWAMVWLSPATGASVPAPVNASAANAIWQRSNRALLARTLATQQIRVSLRDLSMVAGYSITREALTLGGTVSLDDLSLSVRVIGLTYSLTNPSDVDVLIDSRPTRLSRYLAERL